VARDKGNLFSGLCLAAFGIYVISVAVKLPYVSEVGPGPGFFPLWIGIGLVTFATFLIFVFFLPSVNMARARSYSWNSAGRVLAGWAAMMLAIALLGKIGFGLSFILLTIFLLVALDRRSPLLAVGVGVGLAVVFHLIFVVALDVALPTGFWGF
jgi:putative tricarboxylic transport membrane protein